MRARDCSSPPGSVVRGLPRRGAVGRGALLELERVWMDDVVAHGSILAYGIASARAPRRRRNGERAARRGRRRHARLRHRSGRGRARDRAGARGASSGSGAARRDRRRAGDRAARARARLGVGLLRRARPGVHDAARRARHTGRAAARGRARRAAGRARAPDRDLREVGGGAGYDVEAMEGFGVLLAAAFAGVPAVELRAISNAVDEPDRSRWRFDDALVRSPRRSNASSRRYRC